MRIRNHPVTVFTFVLFISLSMTGYADQDIAAVAPKGSTPMGQMAGTDQQTMTDIHDILPLVPVGMDKKWIALGLAIAGILLLVGALWYWKKRKNNSLKIRAVPVILPHQAALSALGEISDIKHIDGKTFYFRLSAIIRQYVHGRFGVGAPEMTTEEFLPHIDRLDIALDFQMALKALCRSSDPVKFAGHPAVEEQMEKDFLFAGSFVEKTKPIEHHLPDESVAPSGQTGIARKGNRLTR